MKDLKILKQILSTVGIFDADLDNISLIGCDPVLSTKFLIGEAGASALLAVGYLSSELYFLRTGRKQNVSISVKDSALAQLSHYYIRLLYGEQPQLWDPLSGFYQDKNDRYIQLHCNFSHHREGVVKYLKCHDSKESVAAAIKKCDVNSLEKELNKLGLCAAKVRTLNEWEKTIQAPAVNQLSLMEVVKIGNSAKEPLIFAPNNEETRPLSDIKALDLTRVIAGPVCAKTLAEHGATVMHVASPNLPCIPLLEIDTGNAKLSTYLDLNKEEDKAQLTNLIKEADIFLQAYRPGGLKQLGFSFEELAKIRPGIIYIELSAYSHVGEWAGRHGYDSLVQSATGIAHEQGSDGVPKHLPAQTLDYVTGYLAAFGAMEAIRRRALDGGSYLVRVSLVQVATWLKNLGRASGFEHLVIPSHDEIKGLLSRTSCMFGEIEQLKPILKMSETMPSWSSAPVTLGTHLPRWNQ